MTPVIVNQNNEVVYEGIDFMDCFEQLKCHFMQNIDNPGKYRVIDFDTKEPADYQEIKRIQQAAKNMLEYGG